MRVLQILPHLGSGGAERLVVDLSNELANSSEVEEVTLLTFSVKNPEKDLFYLKELSPNVKYLNCKFIKSPLGNVISIFRMYFLIKKCKPDIVHFHLSISLVYSILAILFFKKPKYVETLHTDAYEHKKVNYLPFHLQKWIYLNRVSIYSISNANEESFRRCYKFSTKGIVYNGRAALELSPELSEVQQELRSYINTSKTYVFLNVARCHDLKNHTMLIDAFNMYLDSGYDAILLIIGGGFDTIFGQSIKNKATRNIYFLGEKHNVADYYAHADAFCLSSLFEGMPITLIEALYFGLVPICTPTSGAIDIKQNGVGIITDDFSTLTFFNALVEFTMNKDSYNKENIKSIYNEKFSISKCAENYLYQYKMNLL